MALSTAEKTAIVEEMEAAEMLGYGKIIPTDELMRCFGFTFTSLEDLEQMAMKDALEIADREKVEAAGLGIFVCHWLIEHGRYLKKVHKNYRVLMPSENQGQADSYLRSAKKKQARALKLLKTVPKQADGNDVAVSAARALIAGIVADRNSEAS